MRGRMAGQLYAGGGEDTVIRAFSKRSQALSPAQIEQEERFTDGSDAWGRLTDSDREEWNLAAQSVMSKDRRRIRPKPIQGRSLYIGRISKILQAGGTVLPMLPPAARFVEPKLDYALAAATGSLVVSVAEGSDETDVTTEIRVARLSVAYAKPQANGYRTKLFHAFTKESTSVSVPVSPGSYSVIAQSVRLSTGEIGRPRVLDTVTVALAMAKGGADEGATLKKAA